MDDCLSTIEDGKAFGKRQFHLNTVKDVKRKLSFMNKKISDLHHQRKFAYKNSVKVKKMIHNQVNQIVKCLSIRERILCSDVDEAYISQDANISEDLSKLQSIHARCQVLVNHLDDFRDSENTLSKILSILTKVNFGENFDFKTLEFVSDLEAMKTRANNFGHLEIDFFKKDDFVLVANKKDTNLSDTFYTPSPEKDECCDETMLVVDTNYATPCKEDDVEDSFQIIDLLDNMCCHDANEDMNEENLNSNPQIGKEFNGTSAKSENKIVKVCESLKHFSSTARNQDLNLDEEWKQVLEMNRKIADLKKKLKPHKENPIEHKFYNAVDNHRNIDKLNKQSRFLLLKEADNWLYKLSSKKDIASRKKFFENASFETNSASPAELVLQAFKPYLKKDVSKNWLSCN